MKIVRRTDGYSGWAVQMVIPFTFNGELWPQGSYIVDFLGWRTPMPADSFNTHFKRL